MSSITNTTEKKIAITKAMIADDVTNLKAALADLNIIRRNIIKDDISFSHITKVGIQATEKSLQNLEKTINSLIEENANLITKEQERVKGSESSKTLLNSIALIKNEMYRALYEARAFSKDNAITLTQLKEYYSPFLKEVVSKEQLDNTIGWLDRSSNASLCTVQHFKNEKSEDMFYILEI